MEDFLLQHLFSHFSPKSLPFSFLHTQKTMQVIYKQVKKVNRSANKQKLDEGSGWTVK